MADFQARSPSPKPAHRPTKRTLDRADGIAAQLQLEHQRSELFAEVTLKIRQSLQLKEILSTTVTEVQRILQADRVLIYQVLSDGTGKATSEAVLPGFQSILNCKFPEEVFPADYQALYARGRVQAIADISDPEAGLASCLIDFVTQFSIKAKLIVPIVLNANMGQPQKKVKNRLWGLLIAHHCTSPHAWSDFELELMQQLADQIGIAIAQGELLEHLEEIVCDRTAALQQEIADRKQAEFALRRSEEQLRLITNALPVLIAYVDAKQRYQFNNQAYAEWTGLPLEVICGQSLKQVWGQACYQRMVVWVKQALAGHMVSYDNEVQLKEGPPRSISVTYIPHREGATIKGFFSLTSDISDRKAIERMKDEFISVVSHELRTPLTSIHSALKILATGRLGSLSPEGQQMLAIADENTDRLVRLVNNVLDLQRMESGAVTMVCQVYNAAELMQKATATMQAMAQQHGVTLMVEPVSIDLWVDADYLVQAFTNLLSNAIKFSPPKTTVWLTAKPQKTEVLFQIQDEGVGIPTTQLEKIFERFHQVDSSDARKKGGTGLGLTICRKILEQHGGKIWAESDVGQGSRFLFTLPALKTKPGEPS